MRVVQYLGALSLSSPLVRKCDLGRAKTKVMVKDTGSVACHSCGRNLRAEPETIALHGCTLAELSPRIALPCT